MSYRIVVLHRKTYNDDDESSGAGHWLARLVVADRRAAGVMDSHRPNIEVNRSIRRRRRRTARDIHHYVAACAPPAPRLPPNIKCIANTTQTETDSRRRREREREDNSEPQTPFGKQ